MNRVVLTIITFFTVFGLAVGWRLPHILEQQACEEFFRRNPVDSDQYFILENNMQCGGVAEHYLDCWLPLALEPYLEQYRAYLSTVNYPQLAKAAGIEAKYDRCLWLLKKSLHRGEYKQAAEHAKAAFALRTFRAQAEPADGTSEFDDLCSFNKEEVFAENLCSLGMYSKAKSVMLNLPDIPALNLKFCSGPIVGYRRVILAEALLGLKENGEAIEILSRPIQNLIQSNGTWQEIDALKGYAHLARHESKLARETITRWGKRGHAPCELESLLTRITYNSDDDSSCKLSKELISFFDLRKDDVTIPQCLDFCGAAMTAYGHKQAAELLLNRAKQIRDQ